MPNNETNQIDRAALRGSARDFVDYCDEELERRRSSDESFDEDSFQKAVDLVLNRLQVLEEGGAL